MRPHDILRQSMGRHFTQIDAFQTEIERRMHVAVVRPNQASDAVRRVGTSQDAVALANKRTMNLLDTECLLQRRIFDAIGIIVFILCHASTHQWKSPSSVKSFANVA